MSAVRRTPYQLRDASGTHVATHVRYDDADGKRMVWELPSGEAGLGGIATADLPLYGIDRLGKDATVVVVEGEKAADTLIRVGVQAVGTVTGASSTPGQAALAELGGRHVVLWPDNDDVGRAHMKRIEGGLRGIAATVRWASWPDAPVHGDAADYTGDPRDLIDAATPSPDDHLHTAGALRFYTSRQLAALTTTEPEWVVRPGLLAIGAITEIDGKVKSAGKTTLVLHMVRATLDGADFMGQPTRRARVVYVTEQSRQTFAHALRLVGLDDRGDELLLLFREDLHGTPWPKVVTFCRRDGYDVVVFDTIGKLAGIREENSAGEWAVAMSPVQDLAASGRAVVVARHDRKGGGDVGDSGRGSSQASGDVDIILALRRPEGRQSSNRRVVESLSRFRETPDKIVVELTPAGYVLLGTDEAVAVGDARACVFAALGSEYQQTGKGLSIAALVELGEGQVPKVKRWAIQGALASLVAERQVLKTGAGKAGDPHIYSPADSDEGLSGETQTFRSADNSAGASERYQEEPAA